MAIKLTNSNFVKQLVLNHKLVPYLDREIAKGDFEWSFTYKPKERDDGWHPSGDCIASPHLLWLAAKERIEDKVEDRLTATNYKAFAVGHFWHQYLQHIVLHHLEFCKADAIERKGLRSWDGNKPRPFHYVSGSADIAPCTLPTYGDFLVDFKTTKSFDFKQNNLPIGLSQKWECQVNIYLDLFDMEQALIVGILKDAPHDMKEWIFTRNQPLIDAIYQKWQLVSKCLDEDIEPPEEEAIDLPFKGVG